MRTFEEIHAAVKIDDLRAARNAADEASRILSYLIGQVDDDPLAYYDPEVKSRIIAAERWLATAINNLREAKEGLL